MIENIAVIIIVAATVILGLRSFIKMLKTGEVSCGGCDPNRSCKSCGFMEQNGKVNSGDSESNLRL